MSLDETQRRHFREQGYLRIDGAFGASELEALRRAFDRLFERGEAHTETLELDGARFVIEPTGPHGRPVIQRVVWCGAAEPDLMAVGTDARVLGPALDLLDVEEVDHLINQAHFKKPFDGVTFPLHQDAWNRRYGTDLWQDDAEDGSFVQCILTVDPMEADNGALVYVPGSQQEGAILDEDRHARASALAAENGTVPLVAPPGTLFFFGPFLVHGSPENRGGSARRVLVNGYARVGVNRRSYPGAGRGVRRARRG